MGDTLNGQGQGFVSDGRQRTPLLILEPAALQFFVPLPPHYWQPVLLFVGANVGIRTDYHKGD
jgi:hypothetical protein